MSNLKPFQIEFVLSRKNPAEFDLEFQSHFKLEHYIWNFKLSAHWAQLAQFQLIANWERKLTAVLLKKVAQING